MKQVHPILKAKAQSWKELEKLIEALPTTRERGEVFEQFIYFYFTIKKDLYQIAEIYREKDIPIKYRKKFNLESTDVGVDGLLILDNGESAGYQVKFRTNRERPSYGELTKFWNEARLTDHHYTIANCYVLSRLCAKHKQHLSILVDQFDSLDSYFFDW